MYLLYCKMVYTAVVICAIGGGEGCGRRRVPGVVGAVGTRHSLAGTSGYPGTSRHLLGTFWHLGTAFSGRS